MSYNRLLKESSSFKEEAAFSREQDRDHITIQELEGNMDLVIEGLQLVLKVMVHMEVQEPGILAMLVVAQALENLVMLQLSLEALFLGICKQKAQIQESQDLERDLEAMVDTTLEKHHQY